MNAADIISLVPGTTLMKMAAVLCVKSRPRAIIQFGFFKSRTPHYRALFDVLALG